MACNMILRLAMTIVCALAINVSAFTDDYWRQRHEIVKNNTDKLASARGGDELNTKRTAVLNQIALDSFIDAAAPNMGYLCHCNLKECLQNEYSCRTQRGCFFEIQNTVIEVSNPESPLETVVGVEQSEKLKLTNTDGPVMTGCLELSLANNMNCKSIAEQPEFPVMTKPVAHGNKIGTYYRCCTDAMCNDQQHVDKFVQSVRHNPLPPLDADY